MLPEAPAGLHEFVLIARPPAPIAAFLQRSIGTLQEAANERGAIGICHIDHLTIRLVFDKRQVNKTVINWAKLDFVRAIHETHFNRAALP